MQYESLKRRDHRYPSDIWNLVRHFIGRLGYWRKCARSVVMRACTFSTVLRTVRVQSVEIPSLSQRNRLTLDEDLENLVLRVFPNLRGSAMCDQLTRKVQESRNLIDWFRSVDIVPKPHAEVVVLDWFSRNGLCFLDDDRYIACSKPSCHCCALYFQYHPGRILPRRSHGNIWVQWCVPLWEKSGSLKTCNLGILRLMTDATRTMTQTSLGGDGVCRKMFESTIGVTTVRLQYSR